ncbi:hypothetical protein [Mycobacteroides abscessus]|uniref:Transmembrane protein n=5 Tax=Mycobacteroides abscessus TaxID=36809 RepID=A0A829HRD7_9MYCO|nr:hypothetical protein [Mycobacteroides abscessus]ESV57173.1 hypothetical protein L830_3003 [Mycobacteroides abscessus MAB_082312_2258]ESV65558.1 hypothetical protein L833_2950 [Mycobacteroides abscessus MAB_091912_2446]AGM30921.1 hypothetical protein MASS_4319 [Mycobacteroides abscessus subsp. bolletii 50594]AMU28012.1 hypothetical protein A3N96_23530 [Mycobacteroides abscessus]AMU32768.1 hypothetical protein A3N97_20885 [Mycobacteroides abscessus]
MHGRGVLSGVCGIATIIAMAVLLTPVSIQVGTGETAQTVTCGMPVGPRLSRTAELDKISSAQNQSTNYHDQCAAKLDTRRMWAIPIGVLSFVIALCAAGHLWKENTPSSSPAQTRHGLSGPPGMRMAH